MQGGPAAVDPGISGAINANQDCFLHAACQILAHSYLNIIEDETVALQEFLTALTPLVPANAMQAGALAAQLAPRDAALPVIANADVGELQRLQCLVVLRRFLARIDAGGAAIPAPDTAWLRGLLRGQGIVQTDTGQEDASQVVGQILDRFRGRGRADRIQVTERLALDAWQSADSFPVGQQPARRTWDTYRDPHDPDRPAPARPERKRASDEDALYVSLALGHAGLLDWLRAVHGPGVVEDFSTSLARTTHEWANIGAGRTLVSVTQRTVTRKLVSLPDVLTVVLRRGLLNGQKSRRAFAMPEQLALVEHPANGVPQTKHYQLKAFIHHEGARADQGHYYAHRKLDVGGWHTVNNDAVTPDAQAIGAPTDGDVEHDIDHGSVYTYERVPAPALVPAPPAIADGVALDPTQLPVRQPPPLPAPLPKQADLLDELDEQVGSVPRKSRKLRGTGKVRVASMPGLVDTIERLVAFEDRAKVREAVDDEIARQLPWVLYAYTVDIARPGTKEVGVPLMDMLPAMRLLDQVIAWWMHTNATLMARPVDEIIPLLAQYVENVVARLLTDRGKVDIGGREEDEGATSHKADKPDPSDKPDPAPGPTPDVANDTPPAQVGPVPAKQVPPIDPAKTLKLLPGLGVGSDSEADEEEPAAEAPPLTADELAIPAWLRAIPAFEPVWKLMVAQQDQPNVTALRTTHLATEKGGKAIVAFLRSALLYKHEDPSKKAPRLPTLPKPQTVVYDAAVELGLLAKLPEGVRAGIVRPAEEPKAPVDPMPPADPTPAVATPPVKADDVLERAQTEGWVTRRETDQVIGAIGERAFVQAMSRNLEKGKLSKIRGLVEQLGHAPQPGTPKAPPLTSTSLIVDTNLIDVLVLAEDQLSPQEMEFRASILALIAKYGITDLRLANINVGESYQHGELVGTTFHAPGEPPRELPWYGLPLEAGAEKRTGDYHKLFLELEKGGVGEAKGNEDRSMVADAFFADGVTEEDGRGTVPQLATADKGIYQALMKMQTGKDGKPLDPQDYAGKGTQQGLIDELAARTGARFLTPTVLERSLVVHPLVKPIDRVTTAPSTKPPSKDPREAPCGPHTVGELMQLVKRTGYHAVIVGGAVRDTLVGKAPKDVDVKTNMPLATLEELVMGNPNWREIPRVRNPEMHLLKIGYVDQMIDVSCGPDGGKPGAFDTAADAPTRDFRMNAIYMGENGDLIDPLNGREDLPGAEGGKAGGRLRFAVDPGPTAAEATRIAAVVAFLKREPWVLGRALKFITRGYELESEILDGVREHAVEILRTIDEGARPVKTRSLLLFKTDLDSPQELVALMRRFHFSPQAIRLVLPDSVAGVLAKDVEAHDRDVMPRNRGTEDPHALGGLPALKVDMASGRIYQYRVEAVAPALASGQKEEPILIDIDCSNHDIAGHPAPHHHISRWVLKDSGQEGWDKNQAGLSRTGQPGMPALDGTRYLGPQPWRWLDGMKGGDGLLVEVIELGKRAGVAVNVDGEVVDLGGQTRLHRALLQQIFTQGRLHELFVVVRNLLNGEEIDGDDPQMNEMIGTKQGQFRLRFSGQLAQVDGFLESCGIGKDVALFAALDRKARLRLFDLVSSDVAPEARKPAAAWALQRATTIDEFVQRFEFHLASAGHGQSAERLDELWAGAVAAVTKAGAVTGGGAKLGNGDLVDEVKAAADRLGFDSESTAAYHLQKHLDELEASATGDLAGAAAAYLALARGGARDPTKVEPSGEESGDDVLVMWKGILKVVVRVTPARVAYLVTCFTKHGGQRNAAAKPRTIRQAVEPPKPAPVIDHKKVERDAALKRIKPGAIIPHRAPGEIGAGYVYKARVLRTDEAAGAGITEALLGEPEQAALIDDGGTLRVCALATVKVEQNTTSEEDLPAPKVLRLPAADV